MNLVEYMRPNPWKQIKIKDGTMSQRYPHLFSESKMLRLAHKSGK